MKSPALNEAATLWQQGNAEAALAVSAELVAEHPVDVDAAVFYSGLLLHLGRYEAARDWLEETSIQNPENASLLSNLSVAQRKCGQVVEALETAQRALNLSPELLAAWNAFLVALIETDQGSKAKAELRKALRLHPDAPSLKHLLLQLEKTANDSATAEANILANSLIREAQGLTASGALGKAETVYRQAIAVQPDNTYARSGLGELLLLTGRPDEAAQHLAVALSRLPSNARARHLFAVASGSPPSFASPEYVRDLFDGMAETFDNHLRESLAYRIPEELTDRLTELVGDDLGEVLDLGCGTGLVGECLAGHCDAVDGVDLSAEMLMQARAKRRYRRLCLSDIGRFLDEEKQLWQTVTAADVFVYHGKLDELFGKIQRALAPKGLFGFSVEVTTAEGFDVDPKSGRYRHSRQYLQETLQAAGLGDSRFFETTIRHESGRPIAGLIVVAGKHA